MKQSQIHLSYNKNKIASQARNDKEIIKLFMNFLTIEKFNPRSKHSIFKKIVLGLLMLVVPTIFVTAWVVYSLKDVELTRKSQAATRQSDSWEIILATRN